MNLLHMSFSEAAFITAVVIIRAAAINKLPNSVLMAITPTAVAVYGACVKIQGLVTVGVNGMGSGLIPIVAYNYGAKKPERIYQSCRWAMLYSVMLYSVFFLIMEIVPEQVLLLFDASKEMLAIGVTALRIMAVSYRSFWPDHNFRFSSAIPGGYSSGGRNHCPVYGNPAAIPKRRGSGSPGSVGKGEDVSFFFCSRDYESGGNPDLSVCFFLVWYCRR